MNDNIITAGDGSVNKGRVAHSWCIARKSDFNIIVQGAGPTDGNPTTLTLVRPETIGCIAVSSLLHLICSALLITTKIVPYYTDSEVLITNNANKHWHATKYVTCDDIDVIIENNRILRKISINVIPTHVYGQQDRHTAYDDLDDIAKLNVYMDNLAGDFLDHTSPHLEPSEEPILFPSQQIALKIRNKLVTSDVQTELVYSQQKQAIINHFEDRYTIPS